MTVRDAAVVTQRLEMVRRIADEITGYVVELGTDGRLLALQLDELMAGVETDRELIVRDYLPTFRPRPAPPRDGAGRARRARRPAICSMPAWSPARWASARRRRCSTTPPARAATGCWPGCRGCPARSSSGVVDHFGTLQKLLAATAEDLQAVEGVGEARARTVREAISRMADASIIDRYP